MQRASLLRPAEVRSAFLKPDDPALIYCSACKDHLIAEDSVDTTPCRHLLCQCCANKLIVTQCCPTCNAKVEGYSLVEPLLVRIVEQREMKCVYSRCAWKGVYGRTGNDFFTHVEKCPCAEWQCPECGVILTRGDQDTHPVICPLRKVSCQTCDKLVVLDQMDAHHSVCPQVEVQCTFASVGCNVVVHRRDLSKHNVAAMDHHFGALLREMNALNAKHELYDRRLAELNAIVVLGQGRPRIESPQKPQKRKLAQEEKEVEPQAIPDVAPPPAKRRPGRPPGSWKKRVVSDPSLVASPRRVKAARTGFD